MERSAKSRWPRRRDEPPAGRLPASAEITSIGSIRWKRLLDRLVFAIAQGVLALEDGVDLAGSLVNDRRPRVTQKTLGGIFGRVPVRAMHLDGVVRRVECGIRGVLLRDRDVARVPDSCVLHPSDLEVQEPADLVVARHARDHLLDQLVATDLL